MVRSDEEREEIVMELFDLRKRDENLEAKIIVEGSFEPDDIEVSNNEYGFDELWVTLNTGYQLRFYPAETTLLKSLISRGKEIIIEKEKGR